jgi:polysaccharide biosynthesis protein PslG
VARKDLNPIDDRIDNNNLCPPNHCREPQCLVARHCIDLLLLIGRVVAQLDASIRTMFNKRKYTMVTRRLFQRLLVTALVPLLAMCGGAPATPAPTTAPTAAPTAAPATPAPTTAPTTAPTIVPTRRPAAVATIPTPTAVPRSASTAPVAGVDGKLRLPQFQSGVVAHMYGTDRERVLALTKIAGFDWVRQQIHWRDIEDAPGVYKWGELDQIVDAVNAHGLKLLVNFVRSPDHYGTNSGKPNDPKAAGAFVAALAERYGTRIAAIEIWNEPNLAYENGGQITEDDPGKYAEILAECYRRIKAINKDIIVVAAAPSSTGVNNPTLALSDETYLRLMYGYQDGMVKDFFDIQAVHPGGAANSPDWLYPENPGTASGWNDDRTHYFRHVENIRALMVENGLADRQIWITEYGWATPNNTPGFEFGNEISLETQAAYVSRAVERAYREYRDADGTPWVGNMFLWNINFAVLWGAKGEPEHEQGSFGLLNPDWSPRPAFLALQGLHPQIRAEQGR